MKPQPLGGKFSMFNQHLGVSENGEKTTQMDPNGPWPEEQ
jgi:hypothetical protein